MEFQWIPSSCRRFSGWFLNRNVQALRDKGLHVLSRLESLALLSLQGADGLWGGGLTALQSCPKLRVSPPSSPSPPPSAPPPNIHSSVHVTGQDNGSKDRSWLHCIKHDTPSLIAYRAPDTRSHKASGLVHTKAAWMQSLHVGFCCNWNSSGTHALAELTQLTCIEMEGCRLDQVGFRV